MSESAGKAVFLSYASQDAEAARRICEALRSGGVEVWFDAEGGLEHGDEWDAKIRRQIKECVLFIPVISANTQARHEGYFRLEWELAAQRAMSIASGVPFILPVVIDDTREPDALVPDRFRMVQWTRLRGGEVPPDVLQRFLKLWSHRTGVLRHEAVKAAGIDVAASLADARSAQAQIGRGRPTLQHKRMLIAAAILALVAVAGFLALRPSPRMPDDPRRSAALSTQVAPSSLTDAQKLVAQAQRVYENGDELNRENLSLADDLVQQALKLDPAEPTAWPLAAQLSYVMVWQQIDDSDDRRQALQRQAVRAVALAPNSVDAQLVALNSRLTGTSWVASGNDQQQGLRDVERELTALAAREPKNWQVQRALGMACRFLNRPDDSLAAMRRAVELSGGDPSATADLVNVLERRKQLNEAEAIVGTSLARKPTARLLAQDVFFKTRWRGDLAGAEGAIASWPGWLLQDDRGLFMAWQTFFWKREPDKAIGFANRFPRDYLHDAWFAGPRAVLTARAHEMAGHAEAAQADWRSVVQVVARELARRPEDPSALYWKAWACARLGQTDEARAICRVLLQRARGNRSVFLKGTNLAPLLITAGLTEDALADVQTQLTSFNDSNTLTRAVLELDPAYAPIRAGPRFQALVESAPAPPNKNTGAAASADSKSIAVLAFRQLSADPENEYLCEAISDELCNVLGRVPGLKVAASASAFSFKGQRVRPSEMAGQLGVAYLVDGTVQKIGNRVRVLATLIKATDESTVWRSELLEHEAKDMFAVQDEVVAAIAKNLQLQLGAGTAHAAVAVNPEAFRLYYEGRRAWNLRTPEGMQGAEALFNQAIAVDPNYAQPYVGLADVWQLSVPPRDNAKAMNYVQRALAIDPSLAEAHATLAVLQQREFAGFHDAEASFRTAIKLNPNYASAYQWFGRFLEAAGRLEEALAMERKALELDPLSSRIADNYGRALLMAGRVPEASVAFERAVVLVPENDQARCWRAWVWLKLGRKAEALEEAPRLVALWGGLGPAFASRIFYAAGLRREGDAAFAKVGSTDDPHTLLTAAVRGDDVGAKFSAKHVRPALIAMFYYLPEFEALRRDPRFLREIDAAGLRPTFERAVAERTKLAEAAKR